MLSPSLPSYIAARGGEEEEEVSLFLSLSLSLSPSGRPSVPCRLAAARNSLVEIPRDFREREEERDARVALDVHSRSVSIIGKSAGVRARRLADVE